ncbi:N-acetylneuraminate epimerase [Photobacterium sp. MCCC 1A19761]|uniref:N-acetylneuraminate epimerase n=1 Tax=Photobacterium sp. MCCC 1A19761 TaxID=3115000 RepID=UPI00307F9057
MNKISNPFTTPLLAAVVFASTGVNADNLWPDLPVGMKNGVGAQIGDKVFVGLGSAGKTFYMLDLQQPEQGWQQKAAFIGPARHGATAAVVGDDIYVFGGSGKAKSADVSPVLFETVYRYRLTTDTWSQVDTSSPVGLLGAASYSPDGQQIVFFGGYNKAYFDQYLSDINTIDKKTQPAAWQKVVDDYMGMPPLDYRWNRHVLSFHPASGQWSEQGLSPYLPNCGSALVAEGPLATLVSGEIKPGLRTAEVKQYRFGEKQPWRSLLSLPAPEPSAVQEGMAGAFAGISNGALIVAGGANFHGAKAAFEDGKLFAHNGLQKVFNPQSYVLQNGLWSQSSDLPEGLAYGASFTVQDGVLIVGGEKSDRQASNKVYLLAWNGSSVEITD